MKTVTYVMDRPHFMVEMESAITEYPSLSNENPEGQDLLSNENHEDKLISGQIFASKNLVSSTYKCMTFANCVFFDVKIENCNFIGCTFKNCDFKFCDLQKNTFAQSTWNSVSWNGTHMDQCALVNNFMDETTLDVVGENSNDLKNCFTHSF